MKEGTLFLGKLTDTFRFQEDLPNGPHEPLPMWSPQENEPPAPPDSPSAPLLLGKTNGAPAIPSLAALQITTRTPPLPLSSQPNGLMAPNPEPRPFVPENFGPLDSPPDDMVQRSRGIQSGLSGHNQPHLISPHLSSQFRNNVPLTRWGASSQTPASVAWEAVPLGKLGTDFPTFQWPQIVSAAGQRNLSLVANLSFPIAEHVCLRLQAAFARLGVHGAIDVFAIDSPSGFSRNTLGHGRATEKVGRFFGLGGQHQAYFQMTPSIACGRPRGNQWAWMLFGMATFHAIAAKFSVSRPSWDQFLLDGFGCIPKSLGGNVVEVFPRATVQYLRYVAIQQPQKLVDFQQALAALTHAPAEVLLIRSALNTGERTGSDRADALIAGLTTLGAVYPASFVTTGLSHPGPGNYAMATAAIPWCQEGVVYVLGRSLPQASALGPLPPQPTAAQQRRPNKP